jgi:hypothetical protein
MAVGDTDGALAVAMPTKDMAAMEIAAAKCMLTVVRIYG